jgi:hypothetical protein
MKRGRELAAKLDELVRLEAEIPPLKANIKDELLKQYKQDMLEELKAGNGFFFQQVEDIVVEKYVPTIFKLRDDIIMKLQGTSWTCTIDGKDYFKSRGEIWKSNNKKHKNDLKLKIFENGRGSFKVRSREYPRKTSRRRSASIRGYKCSGRVARGYGAENASEMVERRTG